MKNGCLYTILLLLFYLKSFGQGTDVIIWIDNSGSISSSEYSDMKTSIQSIIHEVLECNPSNRVAVVQYGGTNFTGEARIWIESNFTSNETTANSFVNRNANIGPGSYSHEALALIGKALDGVLDTNIVSPQKVLNHSMTNGLAIYLFTDSWRNSGTSYLVNTASPAPNTNGAFLNYTNFKNNRGAKFIVTLVPDDSSAIGAAAAIASSGGAYNGTVESYPNDPDGAGVTGRFFLLKQNGSFLLSSVEIETVTADICSTACPSDLVLTSPTDNVLSGTIDNRQASNSISASNIINSGATGRYHAENAVYLKPGFNAKTDSYFRAYIEGCSGIFAGRIPRIPEEGTQAMMLETEGDITKSLTLSPNPANEKVTVQYDDIINSLTVTSIEGITMFNQPIGKNSFDLYIANYKPGIYIITIQTGDGKILNEKLMKN